MNLEDVDVPTLRVAQDGAPRVRHDLRKQGFMPETGSYTITLIAPDGSEQTILARGDEHIWDAAQRAGIRLPALCHQGWCLTCATLRENGGCVDQRDSVAFYPHDEGAGFALPCTGKPCSNLRLRTHQARKMRKHRLQLHLPAPYGNV